MITILVVGLGSIGRRHAANFLAVGSCRVVGVDSRSDRCELAREELAIDRTYCSLREALAEEEPSAAVIAVPPHLHAELGLEAARAGCHLFMEKPLAMSLDGVDELARECKERDLVAFVAYCHRFLDSVREVRSVLQAGRIGRPLSFHVEFSAYLPDWHPWEDYRSFYMARRDQGGGALLDESHALDLVRHLLGSIESVRAEVSRVSDLEIDSDDLSILLLRCSGGAVGSVHLDLLGRAPRVQMEIIGSEGTLLWDRIQSRVRVFESSTGEWSQVDFAPDDIKATYMRETEHFLACMRGEEAPAIDIDDARKTLDVCLAALESANSGSRVCLA